MVALASGGSPGKPDWTARPRELHSGTTQASLRVQREPLSQDLLAEFYSFYHKMKAFSFFLKLYLIHLKETLHKIKKKISLLWDSFTIIYKISIGEIKKITSILVNFTFFLIFETL